MSSIEVRAAQPVTVSSPSHTITVASKSTLPLSLHAYTHPSIAWCEFAYHDVNIAVLV